MIHISSVGGSCCAPINPMKSGFNRNDLRQSTFKERLKKELAAELQLSPSAAIRQAMMAKLRGKLGRVVSLAETFRDLFKQALQARQSTKEMPIQQIKAFMTVVQYIEAQLNKLDEDRTEDKRDRFLDPELKEAIITQCEKLKLSFNEDDMTTKEGVEAIMQAAQSFDGNLGSFTDDLEMRVYEAYHETDPCEKWGITPVEGGALQSSIQAREMAVQVASSLGKGLDVLLGLDGVRQGMRLVRMLSL